MISSIPCIIPIPTPTSCSPDNPFVYRHFVGIALSSSVHAEGLITHCYKSLRAWLSCCLIMSAIALPDYPLPSAPNGVGLVVPRHLFGENHASNTSPAAVAIWPKSDFISGQSCSLRVSLFIQSTLPLHTSCSCQPTLWLSLTPDRTSLANRKSRPAPSLHTKGDLNLILFHLEGLLGRI